jgi:hypothetical protein
MPTCTALTARSVVDQSTQRRHSPPFFDTVRLDSTSGALAIRAAFSVELPAVQSVSRRSASEMAAPGFPEQPIVPPHVFGLPCQLNFAATIDGQPPG